VEAKPEKLPPGPELSAAPRLSAVGPTGTIVLVMEGVVVVVALFEPPEFEGFELLLHPTISAAGRSVITIKTINFFTFASPQFSYLKQITKPMRE
jgi:hypothetical protein